MEENKRRNNSLDITQVTIIVFLSVIVGSAIFLFAKQQIPLAFLILIIPFVLIVIIWVLYNPKNGIVLIFIANYFAMGIARYLPGPLGLSVDGLLVLTWLSVIFRQFNHKVKWIKAKNLLTLVALIWYGYALFQLINPQVVSRAAWFYAMRGVSLYMLLMIPLVFVAFNKKEDLDKMLKWWAWFTLAGVAKGLMQQVIGPDPWENHWLATVGGKTHLLPGGLRIFSFFTDAATYGGSMGFSGVTFGILFLHTKGRKRYFWLITSLAAFIGMLISGTRGAIAVPFAGMGLYSILSKKFKIVIGGFIFIFAIYGFLKFTTIGNSVYEIRRFRTGLDPNNPSLQVRFDNQQKLKHYLADKPFGGGLGSAGNWGLRFSPGTFLAETPTDSWYVQIWAEQGIIGLTLHLFILFFILAYSSYYIMFISKNEDYKGKAMALLSGMFGIMAASYGSGALGQMPNGIIIYMSMSFIFLMKEWEKESI
ncbi:O-antigen ligase family protein [Plebeiibacterium sediminum]|uniref:O-antigen ligase family protein n=1 Tax=Plebeiibacterium sediminum TaxID=2992112 RepID=A0AAE3SFI5_9BACT|nr:O-antigen ligase family protein [Plebeiobacterium sediminum]MCW3787468.1 O-antigen ligase family protein [Plebeiobacterium sediminum]